ncbi:unnamed protein product, partial [Ixodes persulcatus]
MRHLSSCIGNIFSFKNDAYMAAQKKVEDSCMTSLTVCLENGVQQTSVRPLTVEEIVELLQSTRKDSDCDINFSGSMECSPVSDTKFEDDTAGQLFIKTPSTSGSAATW